MADKSRLVFQNQNDIENSAWFVRCDNTVILTVAEEKAVDSYNTGFECTFDLTIEQASQLKDWLEAVLSD
jgi:hypothetical protein